MNWTIATDKQLLTIVKFDQDCPHSLLSGAVTELLARGLFDRFIADCIHRVTGNIETVQHVHMVGLDDFMQIGRMEVIHALDDYDNTKGKAFTSFAYLKIKHRIIKEMEYLEAQKRDSRKVFSYHNETSEGTEIIELMIDRTNDVERYVINKVTVEQLLKRVNRHQRNVILHRLKGYTFAEISKLLGRGNDRTMFQAYKLGLQKMRKGA